MRHDKCNLYLFVGLSCEFHLTQHSSHTHNISYLWYMGLKLHTRLDKGCSLLCVKILHSSLVYYFLKILIIWYTILFSEAPSILPSGWWKSLPHPMVNWTWVFVKKNLSVLVSNQRRSWVPKVSTWMHLYLWYLVSHPPKKCFHILILSYTKPLLSLVPNHISWGVHLDIYWKTQWTTPAIKFCHGLNKQMYITKVNENPCSAGNQEWVFW